MLQTTSQHADQVEYDLERNSGQGSALEVIVKDDNPAVLKDGGGKGQSEWMLKT